jgi:hypothetical protein
LEKISEIAVMMKDNEKINIKYPSYLMISGLFGLSIIEKSLCLIDKLVNEEEYQ